MTPESANFSLLATEVAASLNAVVPDGFSVASDGDKVVLYHEGVVLRDWLSLSAGWKPDEPAVEVIQEAVWQILEDFQDDVTETLRVAWPEAPRQTGPAPAYAHVQHNQLRWGYTDAIDLPSVDL